MAHRVGLVVFDEVKLLDVAGPSEVLAEANRFGADYRLVLCSVGGRTVGSSTGMRIAVDADVCDPALGFDTLLVAGGDVYPTHPVERDLVDAVRDVAGRSRRVCSICTGAFVLAAAGLLDGRRATTHWRSVELLAAAYPGIRVEPDAIFVRDGAVTTSAGVSAGIDLALALVEEDHGSELARDVARSLVVFLQRPGGQSQFSPAVSGRLSRTPALRAVLAAVAADPAADLSVTRLARLAAVSPRQLTRLFQEELSTTPAAHVQSVRFSTATAALDSGATVEEAAARAGFGSGESMRRVFTARLGISPREYRQRFRTTRRTP
jgi:transcriptional regulator GlxA family with amidase domain